ncbi:ABC transporter substrate-binding protein [Paenibacillus camelliae]|uniref:ABC transporter substrate-binding protein n=1 Tax=Paenibacillus camelliae TaxID=512410 RepID=UPI00203F89DC|nr:ABC transporter substrate-binding protein [Paenibacillus camelliae]MCM3633317.1 ABC transporter substrate-binding protein [Paenibacillus camelliae]
MKKLSSLMLVLILALVVSACGGNNANNASNANEGTNASTNTGSDSDAKEVKITILNSKSEIHTQMTNAAETFSKAHPNIKVEVISTNQDQSPVEKASALYASGTPATLAMLDAGDIEKFADKALDLSGEKWVAELAQPNEINGKTLAFPFAVEGYGLIYNKEVLDEVAGGAFDPATINTTSALEELLQKIEAAGKTPLYIGSMDWSLGNHFLAIAYAAQPDTDVKGFLEQLKGGSADLVNNATYQGLLDTFDVLKKYNGGKNDPMAVNYEQSTAAVATGSAAITFNGNWLITELLKSNPEGEYGFIPVPVSNDPTTKANSAVAIGATKQMFIDNEKSTEEQQAAAKQFLNWLVYEDAGQQFLVNEANVIPAFKNITLELNGSLAVAINEYNLAGNSIEFAGNFVPGDHWKVLGASMQKYLADVTDRNGLAAEIEDYWKSVQ